MTWQAVDARTWTSAKHEAADKQEATICFMGRYDEDEACLLSQLALLIVHRLADLAFHIYEVPNKELRSDFDRWHAEVKRV